MKRSIWTALKEWRESRERKPLLLRGARQVGKTYILKLFREQCFSSSLYLNFEEDDSLQKIFSGDLKPLRIVKDLEFHLKSRLSVERGLLVLDEIQRCPRALTSLKYFLEDMPSLAVCAAGSLIGVQLSSEPFPVGKVHFLDMYPMSFEEFLGGIGDQESVSALEEYEATRSLSEIVHEHLWKQFKMYLVVGGLPEVVAAYAERQDDLLSAIDAIREKQDDLVRAYNADMAKHAGKLNAMHLDRLWRNVPAQLAREQDGSAPKFRFKGVIPGAKGYDRLAGTIDWLHAAGLVIRVPIVNKAHLPFSAYVRENFFKLYVFDVGILAALSGLPASVILDYDYGSYKGYYAENFVAQELVAAGKGPLFSWKERTAEVEFIQEQKGGVLPIEVKSGWVTQAKSLKVFAEKYDPEFVTVMSGRAPRMGPGIVRVPLYLASRFPLLPDT
jgi:predicted AAA+ superfamily ATPase